jgi:hypothetical protein
MGWDGKALTAFFRLWMGKWLALMNTVMKLRVPQEAN